MMIPIILDTNNYIVHYFGYFIYMFLHSTFLTL